jgi:signal transduction histidine kinase
MFTLVRPRRLPCKLPAFFLLVLSPALCAAVPQEQAFAGIIPLIEQWMDVERAFYSSDASLPSIFAAFREDMEKYMDSPLFRQYAGLPSGDQKETMGSLITTFAEATAAGRRADGEIAAKGIRAALVLWQYFESSVSDAVFARTYFLFALFMLIIGALILALWRIHRDLQHSRIQEQGAAAFSRAVIIAQETERSRISVELHDTVLQDLGRLKQLTEEYGGERLRPLLAMEGNIMKVLRSVCQTIMPPDFSRLALTDALYSITVEFRERTGIPCRVGMSEGLNMEGLNAELQLQCYRLVQEAFTNIEKHAHAETAFLTLQNGRLGDRVSLLICAADDGVGMLDTGHPLDYSHMGIRGMYERIRILKGTLSFNGDPGHGLTVRIEIPLGEEP